MGASTRRSQDGGATDDVNGSRDMRARNGWLFPLMVVAAGSVTVFGCIGIAAITGYLPLARGTATSLSAPVGLEQRPPRLSRSAPPSSTVLSTARGGAQVAHTDPASHVPAVQKKSSPQ